MQIKRLFSSWDCSRTVWAACSWVILFMFLAAALAAQEPGAAEPAADEPVVDQPAAGEPEAEPMTVEPAATQPAPKKTSWLGFLLKGGLTMVPIALCSIGFIAIVAAKFSIFRLMRFSINIFAQGLTESAAAGEIDDAIARCDQFDNPITRPLKNGLMAYQKDSSRTEGALREAMLDEVPGLEAYVGWLGIIAGVAPLLGLFGTVIGIIQAFIELAAGGAVTDPSSFSLLADGIYKALITTAAGLFVGIPALVLYEYFRMKIGDLMRDMDRVAVSLLNALGIGMGDGS